MSEQQRRKDLHVGHGDGSDLALGESQLTP